MADDQVKYSDLFDAGIIGEVQNLTNEITSLKNAIAAAKTEANGLRDNLRGAGTATREQQQHTAADAASVEALNRQVKDLTAKLAKLEERKKRYSKLTKEETASVEALRQALAGEAQEQIKATQAIDIQSKSYNELYQTYNALKDALNKMTVAERENSQAGKEMVNRAKEIHDVLDNLQRATGVYTMNIGNYASAFNGLQFQAQQLMREIPSAQNLSQFFLAISNNIPMFGDALTRYKKELPKIRDAFKRVSDEVERQRGILGSLAEGSAEYAAKQEEINRLVKQQKELQELSVSPIKAVGQLLKTWQFWIIPILLLLRKIPDIVKNIAERWDRWRNGVKEVKNEVGAIGAMARLQADVIKKTADEASELQLVLEKLRDVKQGTDEWAAGVRTVNEITKANLDVTKATPAEVEKVTAAYIKQANQLAKNAILSDMIGKSMANQSLRDVAYNPGTYGTARQALGLEVGSKEEKEFSSLFTAMNQAVRDYNNKVRRTEWASVRDAAGNMTMRRVEENENLAANRRRKEMNDAIQDYRNFINKRLEVLSPEAVKKLQEQYELIDPMGSGGGNGVKEPTEQKVTQRYWEAQEAALRAQYEGYALERALAKMNHDKALAEQKAWYTEQQKNLEENVKNGFITREEADKVLAELDRQNTDIEKGIERQYWEDLRALRMKNLADRKKEWKANAEEVEKTAKEDAKARYKALADSWQEERTQLVERGAKRKELIDAEITAEVARLNAMLELERSVNGEKMTPEEKAKIEEWIKLLEKMQKAGNFGDIKPGQIFGKGGANLSNEKKNYSSIWEVLQIDIDQNQISALNSVFDQAKAALNSWMDARKAAADQAKELADDEVSAAENALNREIELRNQGYANNVALRERELADAKEKQKQAVEEQKKIAQQQILLDAALQTSSLITASANILKQFAAQPLLAASLLGLMWGSFGYAKIKAYQASTKSIQFREGGVMLLEGGSHESGHDVNLGIGPDGSNLRA